MAENPKTAVCNLLDQLKKDSSIKTIDELDGNPNKSNDKKKTAPDKNNVSLPSIKNSSNKINYIIKTLPSNLVTPWRLANRLIINEETCADLINSVRLHGQQIPAIVRKITDSNKYELISGARRFYVAKHLGIKLLAAIVDVNDYDALAIMDLENRERQDISAYERGLDYKKWLDEGIYKDYAEISRQTGIKKSLLSHFKAIAELDKKIISAFKSPNNISLRQGAELSRIMKSDVNLKNKMLNKAELLVNTDAAPSTIYQELISLSQEKNKPEQIKATVLVKQNKKPLLWNKKKPNGDYVLTFSKLVTKEDYERIIEIIKNELNG